MRFFGLEMTTPLFKHFLTGNDPLLFRTFFQTNIHFVGANGPLEGLSLFVESNWCWQESDFTSKFRRFYSWYHIYNYIGNIKMIWSDCFFPIPYCARISPQFVGKSVWRKISDFALFPSFHTWEVAVGGELSGGGVRKEWIWCGNHCWDV